MLRPVRCWHQQNYKDCIIVPHLTLGTLNTGTIWCNDQRTYDIKSTLVTPSWTHRSYTMTILLTSHNYHSLSHTSHQLNSHSDTLHTYCCTSETTELTGHCLTCVVCCRGVYPMGGWESNLPGFVKWGLRDGHFNFIFNSTHDTVTVNCYCYFVRSTIGNELLLAVTSLQYVLYGQNNYIRLLSDA